MTDSSFILKQLKSSDSNNLLDNTNELKTIMQKYPYFQYGSILLTKSLLLNNDNNFRATLAKTATIVYDRDVLFNILYNDLLFGESIKSKNIKASSTVIKQKEAPSINIKSSEKVEKPKAIVDNKGDEIKDKKQLMKQVVSNLKAADTNTAKTPKEVKPIDKEVKPEKTSLIKKDSNKKKLVKKVSKTTKHNIDKQNHKATLSVKNKRIKPILKEDSIAIMEKFIKEDPSISKPEDKAYIKELDLAKSSITEEYDIVSETMARLFLAQGNKKKAKKIYEKLSLIYPEKNTYFAARISDL